MEIVIVLLGKMGGDFVGNKYLQKLSDFYKHFEEENGEQPNADEKVVLEEFCDWLQQNDE